MFELVGAAIDVVHWVREIKPNITESTDIPFASLCSTLFIGIHEEFAATYNKSTIELSTILL